MFWWLEFRRVLFRSQREAGADARGPDAAAVGAVLPARRVRSQGHIDQAVVGDAVAAADAGVGMQPRNRLIFRDRDSTRLNSSHHNLSYAVFCFIEQIHLHATRRV